MSEQRNETKRTASWGTKFFLGKKINLAKLLKWMGKPCYVFVL